METGRFSLLHEFLGCLYCLITWQGGFNSRPGPAYFGIGRILLWAELLSCLCHNSLLKVEVWAYVRDLWACALGLCSGPMHILFSTHHIYYNKITSSASNKVINLRLFLIIVEVFFHIFEEIVPIVD